MPSEDAASAQPDSNRPAAQPDGKRPSLAAVYLSVFIDTLGIAIIIPVLPYFVLQFTSSVTMLGVIMTAYSGAQVFGSVAMGRFADARGRRPAILLSLLGSGVGFAICAAARSLELLVVGRVVGGLAGGSIPVAQAAVSDSVPVAERPKYLGLVGATIGIAFTIGPGIGAALTAGLERADALDELARAQVVFGVSAFCSLAALAYAHSGCGCLCKQSGFAETKRGARATPDPGSASASTSASGSKGAVAAGASTCALVVLCGCSFAVMYAFSAMQSTYAVFILDNFGWGAEQLGGVLVASGIVIAILQAKAIKPLVQRLGTRHTAVLGALLLCVGLVGWGQLHGGGGGERAAHLILFLVHVAGYSICNTALPSLVSAAAPAARTGQWLGQSESAAAMARVVSPLVSGALYDESKNLDGFPARGALPLLAGAFAAAATAVAVLALPGIDVPVPVGSGTGGGGDGDADADAKELQVVSEGNVSTSANATV